MSALSTLIAGIIVWGGVGWLLDQWLGTRFIVAIGVVAGLGLSTYIIAVKYGGTDGPPPVPGGGPANGTDAGTREEQL